MNPDYSTSHRGILILVFGILGLVICPLFGPFAWIMGKGDMEKIDQGLMDPEGRSLTQAGMICGIVGTAMILLLLLSIVAVLLFAVLGASVNR